MGFNSGSATGGVSSPSVMQTNTLRVNPTNFGGGGMKLGHIKQGGSKSD